MIRFFGNSRKNRRRESDFVFAVKSSGSGSSRPARSTWWLKPVRWLVILAVLLVGGAWATRVAQDRWLHRVESLALKQIIINREGLLTEDELRRLAGVEVGRNALTVDLYQVRQRLLRHPRIEEARVEIEFPDILRIAVRERVPVARIVLPPLGSAQAYYLVDDLGAVFLPFRRGDVPPDVLEAEAVLPNLVGVGLTGIVSGSQFKDERVLSALRWLSAFERSPMITMANLVEVDVSETGVLRLLTRGGSRITVGAQRDYDRQLAEWFSVNQFGQRQGLAIAQLDLSVTNHPPLRWAEPGTVTPEPVPPVRPTKRKPARRHV